MSRFAGLTVAFFIIFLGGCSIFTASRDDDGTVGIAADSLQVKAVAMFYGDGVYMTDQSYFISNHGSDLVINSIEMGREFQWSLIDWEYKSFNGNKLYNSELMEIVAGAIRANSMNIIGIVNDDVNIHGRWYTKAGTAIQDVRDELEYYFDAENNMITLVKSQGLVARAYEFRHIAKAKVVLPTIIEVFEYNNDKIVGEKVFKVKFTKVVN